MRRAPDVAARVALLSMLGAAGCGGPHSALDPASPAAAAIDWLWWVLFTVTLVVFVVVLAGWSYAILRRRDAGGDVEPQGRSLLWVFIAGALVPAFILVGLTVATIRTSARLAGGAGEDALVVEVVGHQFWWEARYPESGAVTANEIHIPAERPVRVRLTTNDVIHSFWIPRLHGKLDLIPGRVTELTLHADRAGVYRGFCAEFCGEQHALMGILVIAQPEDEFSRWLAHNAAPVAAAARSDPAATATASARAGEGLFVRYQCHLCHSVRGARFPAPVDDVGPDLTHVGSRGTLGAGTIENSPENLGAWIVDPHQFKPGVRMPVTELPPEHLRTLVSYLNGLR